MAPDFQRPARLNYDHRMAQAWRMGIMDAIEKETADMTTGRDAMWGEGDSKMAMPWLPQPTPENVDCLAQDPDMENFALEDEGLY